MHIHPTVGKVRISIASKAAGFRQDAWGRFATARGDELESQNDSPTAL